MISNNAMKKPYIVVDRDLLDFNEILLLYKYEISFTDRIRTLKG